MIDVKQSLAHTTWNCKYHIVFAPKYRRKVFYKEKRREVGKILRTLCEWKKVKILGQHRTIAEASAVESPIRQETIGFPAHFFARAHNFKPPGRACQPEADSPMRT